MANPYRNTGRAGSNSPANNIFGPVVKGFLRGAKAFSNTAKQYYKKFTTPKAVNQQTTREIKPLITGNKVYGRKEIDQAFKNRFGPDAVQAKPVTVTKKKGMFGGTSYGTDVTPSNVTNFNRPDAVVKMREIMKKNNQYPKTDPWRGSPDLR